MSESETTTAEAAAAEQEGTARALEGDEAGTRRKTSLKARMRAREEELSARTSEIFPVPRWESVLAVELKAIPWRRSEEILEAHINRQGMTLASAGDEIAAATVAFYEITEDEGLERVEGETSWHAIALGVVELPLAPPSTAERVAMIALCSDQGVIALNGNYRRWLGGANVGISERMKRDFGTTP